MNDLPPKAEMAQHLLEPFDCLSRPAFCNQRRDQSGKNIRAVLGQTNCAAELGNAGEPGFEQRPCKPMHDQRIVG